MPIVSSVIARDHDRGGGRRSIREHHTDHLGQVHSRNISTRDPNYDAPAHLADHAAEVEAGIVEGERQRIRSEVEGGADPAGLSSDWLTADEIVYEVAKAAAGMGAADVIPVAEWLSALTDADLERIFPGDDPVSGWPYWQAVKARRDNVLSVKAALEADNQLRREVD